jgi:uncharacterized protein YcfL
MLKNYFVRFFILTLFLIITGCTSIMGKESSSENVVIKDHSMSGSGANSVMETAKTYCAQYGARASLRNKIDGSMSPFSKSEYDYYYFDCNKEQPKAQTSYPSIPVPTTPKVSIEVAREKCQSLGIKDSTEEFGKCVLLISR